MKSYDGVVLAAYGGGTASIASAYTDHRDRGAPETNQGLNIRHYDPKQTQDRCHRLGVRLYRCSVSDHLISSFRGH